MFVILLIVVLVLALVALDGVKKRWAYPGIPTVQPCYPVLGNLLEFLGQDMEGRLQTITRMFGTGPRLFKLWLGPSLVVGVTHPELIQKLLTEPSCLEKPFLYDFLNMKHGLVSAKYDFWKVSRKVLNPTMNLKFLHDCISVFERCSRTMVIRMRTAAKVDRIVDVLPFTMQCSLEMICATTMGSAVLDREDNRLFMEHTDEYLNLVAARMFNFFLFSDTIYRKTKQGRDSRRLRKRCLDFALKTIQERRTALEDKNHQQEPQSGPKILIDQVLTLDINREMSDQSLSEQIWTLVAAVMLTNITSKRLSKLKIFPQGSDTTAHGVAHVCLFLAIFPELQERVFAEIDSVLPLSSSDPITPEALKNLPYLEAFFKECLRVAPVGPLLSRTNLAPVELDGHRFPRGTMFAVNFCDLHRRRDLWGPQADRFDPERFMEVNRQRHPYAFLPFSAGSRNCIGWRYAMINSKVMLVHILRNFRLSTNIKYEDLRFVMGITLHLAFKHMIRLEERKK